MKQEIKANYDRVKMEAFTREWDKGEILQYGVSSPLRLPLLEFSAFQVALYHSFVQFLSEFIKEIGAAVVLAMFHVHVNIVAVLDFYSEDFGKDVCQFLHADLSIVDAVTGIEGIE